MKGLHLTADLSACRRGQPALCDAGALREVCLAAVTAAGLTPVAELFHRFTSIGAPAPSVSTVAPARWAPGGQGSNGTGVTGVVLLAESHLAVHTWPELSAVTLDVYVCNLGADNSARAQALLDHLLAAFDPAEADLQRLHRGRATAAIS